LYPVFVNFAKVLSSPINILSLSFAPQAKPDSEFPQLKKKELAEPEDLPL
jgi:hypothetical protein